MLSQVLCETVTFLCVCITEDTDETPKQFFKKATVCFLMLVGSKSSESNTGMYKGWEKITQRQWEGVNKNQNYWSHHKRITNSQKARAITSSTDKLELSSHETTSLDIKQKCHWVLIKQQTEKDWLPETTWKCPLKNAVLQRKDKLKGGFCSAAGRQENVLLASNQEPVFHTTLQYSLI